MGAAFPLGSFLEATTLVVSGCRCRVSSLDSLPHEHLFPAPTRNVFGFCGLAERCQTSIGERKSAMARLPMAPEDRVTRTSYYSVGSYRS